MPWSPFRTRMVVALGVVWINEGLEVTVVAATADILNQPDTLNLSPATVGFTRLFDLRRAPSGSSLTIGVFAGCSANVLGGGSYPGF